MKERHHPEKLPNTPYYRGEEWSCPYFDGLWCELLMLHKRDLTSCRGIYFSCQKQMIRHRRDRRPK